MKKLILLLGTILILSGCGKVSNQSLVISNQLTEAPANVNQGMVVNTTSKVVNTNKEVITNTTPKQPELPESFDLPVTFVSQAPFANWDYLHNEACEEASMIMAVKYFKGEKLDQQIMEDEIQKISKWEAEHGYTVDLTAAEVAKILADYFGVKSEVSKLVTVDNIEKNLASGNLIILPLAGREVGNPYYRQPGPIFHMLLVRGYDGTDFITNDPGTKHGEGYRYAYGTLLWAVHDWLGGARPADESLIDMDKGKKVMIVVGAH